MSDPAFLQFAEQMRQAHEFWRTIGPSFPCGISQAEAQEAERHARLLAAVWKWANIPMPRGETPEYSIGVRDAKAHVRALLAQTEEK